MYYLFIPPHESHQLPLMALYVELFRVNKYNRSNRQMLASVRYSDYILFDEVTSMRKYNAEAFCELRTMNSWIYIVAS